MAVVREVKEGLLHQGVDEQIVYTITTTPWGADPASPSLVVKDEQNSLKDVTATVVSGSTTASGDVITCGTIKSLTVGRTYRVEVLFTSGGSVFEVYFRIEAGT